MGSNASIRGVISLDAIPEFLLKYLDGPSEKSVRSAGSMEHVVIRKISS